MRKEGQQASKARMKNEPVKCLTKAKTTLAAGEIDSSVHGQQPAAATGLSAHMHQVGVGSHVSACEGAVIWRNQAQRLHRTQEATHTVGRQAKAKARRAHGIRLTYLSAGQ